MFGSALTTVGSCSTKRSAAWPSVRDESSVRNESCSIFLRPFVSHARDAGADLVLVKPVPWASLVAQLCPRAGRTEAPAARPIAA